MPNLSDIPGNPRIDDGGLSEEGSALASVTTAGFRSLQSLLGGGLGSSNLQVEIKTVKLDHGVPATVKLNKLLRARGAYVLSVGSADGKARHSLARPVEIIGSSRGGNVKLQASFVDPGATNVPVTVALVPDGNSSQLPISDLAWVAPTLLNGWANFGGGFQTAGYLRDSAGFIHLRGLVQNAGGVPDNTVIFTLPAGFRPTGICRFIALGEAVPPSTQWFFDVNTDGTVIARGIVAAGGFRALNSVYFDTRP